MEEAVQTLQNLAKALRESYETTNTAIPWKEALSIVQSIEKLEAHMKEREKRENDASNTLKTRLEKIERTLGQLTPKKGERERNKGESYAEAAIRGSKAAPAENKNKKSAPKTVENDRQRVVVRILDKDERKRVNNLPLKEVVEKISQGNEGTHPAQQIVAARRLPQGEIALYTEESDTRTKLQGD